VPENVDRKDKTYNFKAAFYCFKEQEATVSIEDARALILCLAEAFRKEIDRNEQVRPLLFAYPTPREGVSVCVYFKDHKRADLKQGVTRLYLYNNRVVYMGYKQQETPLSQSMYCKLYQESYDEALEIVQKQGRLIEM
jgi:hypothetical protein